LALPPSLPRHLTCLLDNGLDSRQGADWEARAQSCLRRFKMPAPQVVAMAIGESVLWRAQAPKLFHLRRR
jgi:hypothetical protein